MAVEARQHVDDLVPIAATSMRERTGRTVDELVGERVRQDSAGRENADAGQFARRGAGSRIEDMVVKKIVAEIRFVIARCRQRATPLPRSGLGEALGRPGLRTHFSF